MRRPGTLALALPLWMCFGSAAALHEPQICYVLDGILFLYGVVLTTLYCRLKVCWITSSKKAGKEKKGTEEPIYTGLTQPADTYETIGLKT